MPGDPGFICPTCGLPQGDPRCTHSKPAPAKLGAGTPALGTLGASPLGASHARPGSGYEQGIDVGAKVVPEGDCKLTALGFEGCGKTTYIGMLYFLLVCGRFPGFRFAWSDSLRELETIRAQLHRPVEQGGPTFPPRTSRDKTIFLHLGLRRWDDDRYVDVYFPEFSGEDVGQVWTTGKFPENLSFIGDMNGYIVFLDATAVSMKDLLRAKKLFSSLLELKKTRWLEDPVAIVLAKWDSIGDAATPEELVRSKLQGLYESWEGTLKNFRLFGVSSIGSVRKILGRDGRPATGPSGEELSVPAPEQGDDEHGPLFRYRPKNVSRPLVWLLYELMGGPTSEPLPGSQEARS